MAAALEKEKDKVPPYLPYRTLKNFLRSLSQGIPPRFEKRMFASMSGSTQSQLVQTLKSLGLMDDQWVRTEKLKELVTAVNDEAGYKNALRKVLLEAYPFLATFDLPNETLGQLQQEMQKMGASGGTVSKCIAFLIPAAKDAGMEVSPYIEKPAVRAVGAPRPRRQKAAKGDQPPADLRPPPPHNPEGHGVGSIQKLLLDKYPAFDPSWDSEVQAKWFDGFARLQAAMEGKAK